MSGEIVERRDQVLTAGGFLPPSAILLSAFCRLRSINGPFLTERGIYQFWISDCGFWILERPKNLRPKNLFPPPIFHDHVVCALIVTRLVTSSRLPPRCDWIASTGRFAFTAAMRVIDWVHGDA